MQFNESKFEQMSHGDAKNVGRALYKTKSGESTKSGECSYIEADMEMVKTVLKSES